MALVRVFREDTGAAIVSEAAHIVQGGGVIAMPTDSLYALVACAFDDAAVRRVCAIKGQRERKPILVLISDRSQLAMLAARVPRAATVLMDRFWPGPLTIVFPASPRLPIALTAGTGTIGVRLPAQPLLAALLHATGPLTGTSANRSDEPPARTACEVQEKLGNDVDLIVDGGPAPVMLPSTVVEVGEPVRVLREGPIGRAALAAALEKEGIAVA
ncbi:MAG: threonylcarbamoyl-AMP synthase [Nitrospirae bacterium RIFCSPLOWO2_02_FULL_62_14]|nr:MAG: threonylcarbamoyl-AMP synthase [Nitrospirae bacterium RIFCSPLOWO2_02_FULL_62_14]OGW86924.1 MAG: threonylcarbamoyl-AMP synthase [Nitrospirae bacterium RIFCSPLOWO2_12_FULL_63_8]